MKIAFRKHKYSWFVVFCSLGIFAIVACNIYLLCCGRCVVSDFLRIPPMGWFIIAANLVAGLILVAVKRRGDKQKSDDVCSVCHIALRDNWVYCPNCGHDAAHRLQSASTL
ncbi:MAG: hypothetical protein GWO23_18935 [Gammaproteobacteria bacterium]|nr:hypothetical protein [Gammaproteobacteria bacterium]